MVNKKNKMLLNAFKWAPLFMFFLCYFLALNIIPTIAKMFGSNTQSYDALFMGMHIGILVVIPIIYVTHFYIEARKDILNKLRDKYCTKVEMLCILGVAALFLFVFELLPCMIIILVLNVIMKLNLSIGCMYCAYNLILWLIIWPFGLCEGFVTFDTVELAVAVITRDFYKDQ